MRPSAAASPGAGIASAEGGIERPQPGWAGGGVDLGGGGGEAGRGGGGRSDLPFPS